MNTERNTPEDSLAPPASIIPFNKPFIAGKELSYIAQAVAYGNIGGDGHFTQACSSFLEERFNIHKVLMTPSCTAALEMAAMLCDLEPGDEVIMPSYTFVSTANAFVREGAKPVFVDIRPDTLNLDENLIEQAITPRTKVIVPVHYAGNGCAMDRIMEIAEAHNLIVVEDAAQGVNSFYQGRALGSIGHMGTYSFHETKNYICGEGGALCVNWPEFVERAEILRDKGTNRKQFFRGQVDKYTWVDIGSSYVPSEICCAFLFGQFEQMDAISLRRKQIYETYATGLRRLEKSGRVRLPQIPKDCSSNYHMFYLLFKNSGERDSVLRYLKNCGINSVFHYSPLHLSPMASKLKISGAKLPNTEHASQSLARLPFYFELSRDEQRRVIQALGNLANNT